VTILSYFRTATAWGAILLAFIFPISVALGNVLLMWLLLCGVLFYPRPYWKTIKIHPVALASVLLFAALLLGCFYGESAWSEALQMIGKYIDLAFVPLLIVLFSDTPTRTRAENAFLLAMLITTTISWAVGLSLVPESFCLIDGCGSGNPTIFCSYIAQNLMMTFAGYLLLLRARQATEWRWRLGYAVLASIMLLNVLFLGLGRTGYLVLSVLIPYFLWTLVRQYAGQSGRRIGYRGVGLMLALVIVGGSSIYRWSPTLHQRIDSAVAESQAWLAHGDSKSSMGLRFEFYANTLDIIGQHPWLGVGTGGFAEAYRLQVADTNKVATRNPHNEYLNVAVQLGVVGGGLLLYLIYAQWRTARRIDSGYSRDAATGIVLTLVVTGLFNTPLMDHTEGLFFACMTALCFAPLSFESSHV